MLKYIHIFFKWNVLKFCWNTFNYYFHFQVISCCGKRATQDSSIGDMDGKNDTINALKRRGITSHF